MLLIFMLELLLQVAISLLQVAISLLQLANNFVLLFELCKELVAFFLSFLITFFTESCLDILIADLIF